MAYCVLDMRALISGLAGGSGATNASPAIDRPATTRRRCGGEAGAELSASWLRRRQGR